MGLFSAKSADDTWRAELTWRAGPPWMQRGTEATWQGRAWPTQGVQVARMARTRGRRPRGSTRTPVRGATWRGGLASEGHTG